MKLEKQIREADQLKMERQKNEQLIQMQKEQEVMKNSSIKDMIRSQKMMAEEKKEMVSSNRQNLTPNFL